ncbi:MAG TPA: hypothetical protein VFY44_07695, partial [Thermoleophilaceae bacterium]|nr:hypothetical protein [Thermoleophilaceae bacterium]
MGRLLRSRRLQVSVALAVAAAACAYAASKTSGDELAGAYRESGHALLATAATHDLPGAARAAARPAAL